MTILKFHKLDIPSINQGGGKLFKCSVEVRYWVYHITSLVLRGPKCRGLTGCLMRRCPAEQPCWVKQGDWQWCPLWALRSSWTSRYLSEQQTSLGVYHTTEIAHSLPICILDHCSFLQIPALVCPQEPWRAIYSSQGKFSFGGHCAMMLLWIYYDQKQAVLDIISRSTRNWKDPRGCYIVLETQSVYLHMYMCTCVNYK